MFKSIFYNLFYFLEHLFNPKIKIEHIENSTGHTEVKEHAHSKQPKIHVGNVPNIDLSDDNTDVNIDLHEATVKALSPVKRKVKRVEILYIPHDLSKAIELMWDHF